MRRQIHDVAELVFGTEAALESRRAEALRILKQLERMSQTQYVEAMVVAALCSALNDDEQTMVWLKRAEQERSSLFA